MSVITTPGPTVKQGQHITMMCQDICNEHENLDNVLWKHNKKMLPNKRNVLQLKNVLPNIAGEYICIVWNTAGEDSDRVNITVTCKYLYSESYQAFWKKNPKNKI